MKHYIIVKFRDAGFLDREEENIRNIFEKTKALPGIQDVWLFRNCVFRPNRADLMIEIEMEKDALPVYDGSEAHKEWKEKYADHIETKTIFDRE